MRRLLALGMLVPLALLVACADGGVQEPSPTPDMSSADIFVPPPAQDMFVGQGGSGGAVPLGEFLDTCVDNAECASGFCIEIEQEDRTACSQRCLQNEQCPAGWSCRIVENTPPDVVSICFPRQTRVCGLCAGDGDCPGGHCYLLDGASICGFDCESDDDCTEGFTCGDIEGRRTCTPVTGSCSCDAESAGDERLCLQENAFGSCIGRETCDPAMGWIGCDAQVPSAEVCNQIDDDCNGFTDDIAGLGEICEQTVETEDGQTISCAGRLVCTPEAVEPVCTAPTPMTELCNFLDDDCDGQTDEGFEDRGQICAVGDGACRRVGVQACSGDGLEVVCDAVPGDPVDELCNGVDDDCDGTIDEAFPGLNEPCFAGEGACQRAGALRCADDGMSAVCTAEAAEAAPETCDGVDNDCDGQEDEGYEGLFEPCSTGVGACLRQGFLFCTDDGLGVACTADAAEPGEEICNGIDDNCDGTIDEGYDGLNEPCSVGIGICRGAGVTACSEDGGEVVCNAQLSPPADETCNGLDDDCDGATDEAFADLGTACTAGVGACQQSGVNRCSADGAGVECSASPSAPNPESCNGLDDDCDGTTDEGYPDLATACAVGEGVCAAQGVRVCSADGEAVECDAEPGEPGVEICNGLDDDCDGTTDEGFDGLGEICSAGDGLCRQVGITVCAPNGLAVQCSAEEGRPAPERCDGLDNDCDGATDEGFAGLGTPCAAGVGVCLRQGITVCDAAGAGVECNAEAGDPGVEICNGLDDDCDGTADELFPTLNTACTVGDGVCRRFGVNICAGDGLSVVCDQQPGRPEAEACNNLDDDCDGSTDEAFVDLGTPCAAGEGVCRRTGFLACNAVGDGVACDAEPGPPGDVELCNYQDDTCDGRIDEGFVDGQGRYFTTESCGACGTDCAGLWDPDPAAFGVAPRCEPRGGTAVCTFDCLPGFIDADGRPDNGCELVADPEAVYVATAADGGIGAANCGGLQNPCASIAQGIGRAVALRRIRVRVAEGVYRESVTLQNGIDVLGGHDPVTWVREPQFNVTIISGSSPANQPDKRAVIAQGINQPTTFDGFVVNGESSLVEGNSYAIYVLDSGNALTISNNRIFAGNGGRGSDGPAGAVGVPGRAGAQGQDSFGVASPQGCGPNPGGGGGARTCGGVNVNGGAGGRAGCPQLNQQEGSGSTGATARGGRGGAGAFSFQALDNNSCTVSDFGSPDAAPGAAGQSGVDGGGGQGAAAGLGAPAADWRGSTGGDGVDGQPGGGGGGGGAAAGVDAIWAQIALNLAVSHDIGASGGGGGSGGCNGTAGQGGTAGGASFGVFVAFSGAGPANQFAFPQLVDNEISRGLGGNGGAGGNGGGGGEGGPGGAGGQRGNPDFLFMAFCSLSAGDGAVGGRGGHGGGGGGGQGGVSYDIFVANDNNRAPDYAGQNVFTVDDQVSTHGFGGVGGNSSNTEIGPGAVGADGQSGNVATLP